MSIGKAALVPELACRDAVASMEFYTKILGFKILYERSEHKFYYLEREGLEIMLDELSEESWITGDMKPPFGRGMHFQMMITGLDKLYKNCLANHIPMFNDMEEAWYRAGDTYVGQKQFVIQDPDGFLLRFAEDFGEAKEPPNHIRV